MSKAYLKEIQEEMAEKRMQQDILNYMHQRIIALSPEESEPLAGFAVEFKHNGKEGRAVFNYPQSTQFIDKKSADIVAYLQKLTRTSGENALRLAYQRLKEDEIINHTDFLTLDLIMNSEEPHKVEEVVRKVTKEDFLAKHTDLTQLTFFYADFLKNNKDKILPAFPDLTSERYDLITFAYQQKAIEQKMYEKQMAEYKPTATLTL